MIHSSCFQPPCPTKPTHLFWRGLPGASCALTLWHAAKQASAPLVILTNDVVAANQLQDELAFFGEPDELPILMFPDLETLPYDQFSPHQDIISERLAILAKLPSLQKGIVIVSLASTMLRLAPTTFIQQYSFSFKVNDQLSLEKLQQQLAHAHYHSVSQVMEHGEFSVRGGIIDIFPMGSTKPIRLDLFDDSIESIRTFDVETQLTIEKISEFHLLPANEYPMTEEAITQFRKAWRSRFAGNPIHCPVYEEVSKGINSPGLEYYLPLFFDNTVLFYDYLPENALIFSLDSAEQSATQFWHEVNGRFEQRNFDITRPLLKPVELYCPVPELFQRINKFARIILRQETTPASTDIQFPIEAGVNYHIHHHATNPLSALIHQSQQYPGRILICAESAGRREILQELLNDLGIRPTVLHSWNEFLNSDAQFNLLHGLLMQGFASTTPEFLVVTETQLFGEIVLQQRKRGRKTTDLEVIVRDLTELHIGSPVVHLDHGVGRYMGLTTLTTNQVTAEYITLHYADSDKIYVPVTSLQLLSRYTGLDPDLAPLDKLGSDRWQKAKRKALNQIHDVATELLEIYAKRELQVGNQFATPESGYHTFAARFPYDETPDQAKAIHEVISDMTSTKKMDRLICGDVGFGKTEVAMRAAYIAASNNKQVAILVPTTLLATQHYQNFSDRFADFAVNIQLLSRMRTDKEQQQTIQDIENGKVDIIIGTHRILQKDMKFLRLGLVIIDEEHRFGVKQKEMLKKMRSEVDILTLTATPIPRTLNMSLSGLRDISIISTPPLKRMSIKTFCYERNPGIIREAILREILRGGQVFFVHNRVESIQRICEELNELVPEAKVQFAHGQMHERAMEKVMRDFYHHRFNVLVCTTIVENGIDIPTANTIIIDRADHFGLAQLHQLRGRVGRSHHQAYAYLMIPGQKLITSDAKKRLDAFQSLEDLGAGFNLSMHDLEIRGAGELLGDDQSGNIETIGYSLYMEMLDKTVKALKSGKAFDIHATADIGPDISLNISALIPDSYIPDVHLRLMLYKRINQAADKTALRELQVEMIDRFGLLPQEVKNLFRVTELKLKAKDVGIKKIDGSLTQLRFEFGDAPKLNTKDLIILLQVQPKTYKMEGQHKLRYLQENIKPEDRIQLAFDVIQKIAM